MIEAYITQAGRTVLFRRYNGNRWAKKDAPPHNWGEEMTPMGRGPATHRPNSHRRGDLHGTLLRQPDGHSLRHRRLMVYDECFCVDSTDWPHALVFLLTLKYS